MDTSALDMQVAAGHNSLHCKALLVGMCMPAQVFLLWAKLACKRTCCLSCTCGPACTRQPFGTGQAEEPKQFLLRRVCPEQALLCMSCANVASGCLQVRAGHLNVAHICSGLHKPAAGHRRKRERGGV